MKLHFKRILGYILGFCMLYAPFALLQKTILYIFTGQWQELSIHSICFRIQTEHLLDGKLFSMEVPFIIFIVLLMVTAFVFGPVFCGKLCPAGAFTEYLNRLFPDRFKIRWSNYIDIIPVRYGMLTGFMLLPFFNGILACSYCNFFLFDLFINYFIFGYMISFSSSLLLTLVLWIVVFGIFTKGGRGYCNFLCPVGALQNLLYYLAFKLGVGYKLAVNKNKCIGCGKCKIVCPMDSISMINGKAEINIHNCIICNVCSSKCAVKAINYINRSEDKDEK